MHFHKEMFIKFDRQKNDRYKHCQLMCKAKINKEMFIIVWIYYLKNYSIHQWVCKSILFSGLFLYVSEVVKVKYVFNWWKNNEHKYYVMSYRVHKTGWRSICLYKMKVCCHKFNITFEIMFPWNVSFISWIWFVCIKPENSISAII